LAGLGAGIVALLLTAIIIGLIIRRQVIEQQKKTQASSLVRLVLNSETAKIPAIVVDMADCRRYVDPLLREECDNAEANSRQKLHASLALLSVDLGQVDYLAGRLLKADPQEIVVIREALLGHHAKITEPFWKLLENPETTPEQRLRAASALSIYAPNDARWEKVSADVAATLINQDPFVIAQWTAALKGVRQSLTAPLADLLTDEKRALSSRALIAKVYGFYAAESPDSYARLEKQLEEKLAADASVETKVTLAKKHASIGVALMIMGRSEKVWPLLRHSPIPTLRSYLIDRFATSGVDHIALIARLGKEQDSSIRQAILQSLGEYELDRLSQADRRKLIPQLLQQYQNDPDPGIHGAAEWLLCQWQATEEMKKIKKELETGKVEGKRLWYLNKQGHTMVVIPKPGEFWMGENEERHHWRIGRTFAIASKEVTVNQFLRFRKEHEYEKEYAPTGECPVNAVSWFEAAAYCNWLSKEEGIPKEQWCFAPNNKGKYAEGMSMAPDYLNKTGYRLPSEVEWEYACRAGTETAYSCGDSLEYFGKYGWSTSNSLSKSHPVASLKSNDFGLFDMHGNNGEWCQDLNKQIPSNKDTQAKDDIEGITFIHPGNPRAFRGGAFLFPPTVLRSSYRYPLGGGPSYKALLLGFRVTRTITPLSSQESIVPPRR